MTELEFAERLKQYRKARNMTQQELADRLGVSNKSVSRWETGGYPDVALLGPLAKALGVTVDDLLGDEAPIRKLERADWQNLLSFAFAIGGGVLFFLLDLFAPTLVCYLLYLGAMAYGVYLQRHYTYHSRWFHAANLVMNFFVNFKLLSPAVSLVAFPGYSISLQALLNELVFSGSLLDTLPRLLWLAWPYPAAALVLTAVTGLVIWRVDSKVRLRLRRAPFDAAKLPPALCPLLSAAFFLIYSGGAAQQPAPLAEPLYTHQSALFYGLLALLTALSAVYLLLVRRRQMLPAALTVSALSLTLPAWPTMSCFIPSVPASSLRSRTAIIPASIPSASPAPPSSWPPPCWRPCTCCAALSTLKRTAEHIPFESSQRNTIPIHYYLIT